jgi:iron(III) transport system permease protein
MTVLQSFGLAVPRGGGFTLAHWAQFAGHPDEWLAYWRSLWNSVESEPTTSYQWLSEWLALWRSLWISVASVALAAAVGVPLGFVFERTEFPGRRLLGALIALPVALPPLVGVIAFFYLYGESGFVPHAVQALLGLEEPPWRLGGAGAILLVHAYSMYVYFYLFTRAGLARLDAALLEAAASLGAGRARTLGRVVLPLLRPALAGAALLTFMTALASFSAPYIFGGGFRVMTTQIVFSRLNGEDAMAQVETVTLALVALAGLWVLQKVSPPAATAGAIRGVAPARRRVASRGGRALAAAAGWGLAALLLLPHATLVLISLVPPGTWTVEALPPVLDLSNYRTLAAEPERLRPVVNSLWMAAAATAAAVALGLAAARAALRRGGRLGRLLEGLVALPWAIPGTVFAVALATTFSANQPWLGRFVLVGTPWILPLAYLVRNLPMTGRAALAGLGQLDPALEEAAASLGAGPWRTLRRVVLPLVAPAIAAGASLAFITALGDFVVSIVLYTYSTRPISIEILSSLRLQELGVGAVYGVLLMVAGGAAFLLWGRREAA